MIRIVEKKSCCGCSACIQICPKKCIEMKSDSEGFLYPNVDETKCINCGMCEKVCPIINKKEYNEEVNAAYVAYSRNNEIRLKSSSGGLFSEFADTVLDMNGVVFGASMDENMKVNHIFIDNVKDLDKLRGSKYVQSDINKTYNLAKEFLQAGRIVLYTGTACQITGLKQFLQKEYNNLYTIDVLCHGVPSPLVWERYIREKEEEFSGRVQQTFFRQKTFGWKTFAVSLLFNNDTAYEKRFGEDIFMKLFLKEICLRPSCHDCKFKAIERSSDITLGDCWGIGAKMPEMDDDKGTSVILVHSEKGQEWLESISDHLVIKQAEADFLLPPMADSRKSVKPHKNRDKFFERLKKGESLSSLVKLVEDSRITKTKRRIKHVLSKIVK